MSIQETMIETIVSSSKFIIRFKKGRYFHPENIYNFIVGLDEAIRAKLTHDEKSGYSVVTITTAYTRKYHWFQFTTDHVNSLELDYWVNDELKQIRWKNECHS
jgi:hypothetical protein